MSLLQNVADINRDIHLAEQNLADAIIQHRLHLVQKREELDTAMVYAVDWGNHPPTEVAMVAGYKSHAAIRDARKRIEKREAEVR